MTNRLAAAQSLYLRKHAENPIDWYPWGAEALETAKRENSPSPPKHGTALDPVAHAIPNRRSQ
jgi:Protein of unknown function, DUF255